MMNKTLLQILPPPNISPRTHQWNQVETELHVCLPDDYKQLMVLWEFGIPQKTMKEKLQQAQEAEWNLKNPRRR